MLGVRVPGAYVAQRIVSHILSYYDTWSIILLGASSLVRTGLGQV